MGTGGHQGQHAVAIFRLGLLDRRALRQAMHLEFGLATGCIPDTVARGDAEMEAAGLGYPLVEIVKGIENLLDGVADADRRRP